MENIRVVIGALALTLLVGTSESQVCRATCTPPDCSCPRTSYPMDRRDIPQMVYFGFDDAVNVIMASLYNRLFTKKRINPNGCNIKMTLFISHQYTDYKRVKQFYRDGMEIAVHSVTHTAIDNDDILRKEAKMQKENLMKLAGVKAEDIVGWRSPFLKTAGDNQPQILKELGYEYDISLTYSRPNMDVPKPWPFTMDNGWPYRCGIKPCPSGPSAKVNNFWAVPVVSLMDYKNQYPCSFVDGCAVRASNEKEAFDFLWNNFMSYYNTTRTPFGLNMHAAWFYTRYNLKAMMRFLDELQKMDDVYVVTVKQMLDWMRDPTPVSNIKNFKPWGCEQSRESTLKQGQPVKHVPANRHFVPQPTTPKPIKPARRTSWRQEVLKKWRNDRKLQWPLLKPLPLRPRNSTTSTTTTTTPTTTPRPTTTTRQTTTTKVTATTSPTTATPTTTTTTAAATTTTTTTKERTKSTDAATKLQTQKISTRNRTTPIKTPTTTSATTTTTTTTTEATTTTKPTTTTTTTTTTTAATTTTKPTTTTTTKSTTTASKPTTTTTITAAPTFKQSRQELEPLSQIDLDLPTLLGLQTFKVNKNAPDDLSSAAATAVQPFVSSVFRETNPPIVNDQPWWAFWKQPSQQELQPSGCVQGTNCHLPECYCQGTKIPKNLKLSETPQMVYLTIDGSMNAAAYRRYRQLVNNKKNPNGCRVRGTIFASQRGTMRHLTKKLINLGAEVAMQGLHEHHFESTQHMEEEIIAQLISLKNSGVNVTGWKTPELKSLGNEQFRLLQKYGFKYDATLSENTPTPNEHKPWPYTLDYGYSGECVIPKCPTKRFPGLWEIPTVAVMDYRKMFECNYVDGCMFNPPSSKATAKFLWDNFMYNYKTNRAPFGIHLRQVWFTHPVYSQNIQGLKDFLSKLLTLKDVYIVAADDIITWMKNPVPVSEITARKPWDCKI